MFSGKTTTFTGKTTCFYSVLAVGDCAGGQRAHLCFKLGEGSTINQLWTDEL